MIKLRNELEPDMKTAKERFPIILKLIEEYADQVDEAGDEEGALYRQLEELLHNMTGKDMSRFNLLEWWEEEGAEVLAFRISLPDPVPVKDITKEELAELIRRIKEPEYNSNGIQSFEDGFRLYLDQYYHQLLKLSFSAYDIKLFQRNRDEAGKYFEYTTEEIIEHLWLKK